MKKRKNCICILLISVFLLCSFCPQVYAKQMDGAVTSVDDNQQIESEENSNVEDAKESVVQVVVQYVDSEGKSYLLKSGSGLLISGSTVLTNYHLVTLTDEEKERGSQYLTEQTGRPISLSKTEGGEEASYQIGIVVLRDVVISATIHDYSSRQMDLAILNLSDTMNRQIVSLGNSDEVENGEDVYALGYKKVAVMSPGGTELLSRGDCKEKKGKVNKVVLDSHMHYITHTAEVHEGNSGGPLVDSDGNVVGINIFGDNQEGEATAFKALAVNEVKQLLDDCELTYQEAGLFPMKEDDVISNLDNEKENSADTSLLDNYIVSFNMLEQSNYTKESYDLLRIALEKAREIKSDKGATQEEVDDAVFQLESAKSGLQLASKVNWPFIITMVVLVIVVIGGLVIYILNLKGIIGNKREKENLMVLNEMTMQSRSALASQSGKISSPVITAPKPRSSGRLNSKDMMSNTAEQETSVLGSFSQEEGTTVLGVAQNRSCAYLTRLATAEKIVLDVNEFTIGKDRASVSYCIGDNGSVSRQHARIVKKGMSYYISDLNSTNYTYLNERILMSGEEAEIVNGDIIKISNEEFLFSEA